MWRSDAYKILVSVWDDVDEDEDNDEDVGDVGEDGGDEEDEHAEDDDNCDVFNGDRELGDRVSCVSVPSLFTTVIEKRVLR